MAACDRERNKKFFRFTVCILLSGKLFFYCAYVTLLVGAMYVPYAQDTINTMDD